MAIAHPAAPVETGAGSTTRWPGLTCLVAGLLGAASGILLAVIPPQVPVGRYSYPLAAAGFLAIQIWFGAQHLGLLAGQLALRSSGATGRGRLAGWGHGLGIGGMLLLAVTEWVAITAFRDPYPSPLTTVLDALYGVASISIGVGLVLVGIAVRGARVWRGWRSWVPLTLGVWVFVPMLPALMAGHVSARLAITGWMLLFAALGWALAGRTSAGDSTRP